MKPKYNITYCRETNVITFVIPGKRKEQMPCLGGLTGRSERAIRNMLRDLTPGDHLSYGIVDRV